MSYRSEVVTVFGGSGFVGRHLIRRLAKTGAIVRVVSRHPNKANFLKTAGSVGQIVPMAADVKDDQSVARAIQGADTVINLIGTLYERGAWNFQTVHVDAPARIARIAKASGVRRLVHVSAIGADAKSASAYAKSKAAGEQAVAQAFPGATIVRPSIVFGPEDGFFNKFAAMAQVSPALPLIGGSTKFQPVYVGDLADAIAAAATLDSAVGRTFELGGPRVYSFKELMQLMLREIRRKRFLVPVPWNIAETLGGLLEKVPPIVAPPLTRDQVEMLRTDNVAAAGAPGFKELGITNLSSCEVILPTYLSRFIVGGRSNTMPRDAGNHSGAH
ncbi:complex I NDUFA9 subunit family protein (plasmid) [Azospirillum baldaniorum]|uniref:NAD-dependent epimerase/dehydratase n=1 Tax=Azospirillum baldaniorum TaxID=1064539 RepID=A0A9P1NP89_9PROT|nr:complex I NDUFA9 subunit family protein [Azospirillum baldaniorum]AWJ92104.1 complex I NDUFA9 subunit family protein [Azospirillum baldaniorum]TWA73638.1 NADH dehydrogenase [Azospirillum brasilense]CCD00575.1 putative NAD-dependent epimerase/dehydratase [Azospirillum baldaniorum]